MSSKDKIIAKLRSVQKPFTEIPAIEERRHVVTVKDDSPDGLLRLFAQEAEKIGVFIYKVADESAAFAKILELLEGEKRVLAWDDAHIPIADFSKRLSEHDIVIAPFDDGNTLVSITGVDAALAATGSLVLSSGAGKFRTTSLLPDKHIAVLEASRLVADFETWAQGQGTEFPAFRQSSNTVIVSGPSKTADIAQELIKGAHGPRQVHVIVIEKQ